jgi:hypothetical protein
MNVSMRVAKAPLFQRLIVLVGLLLLTASPLAAEQPGTPKDADQQGNDQRPASVCEPATLGSPYIPVDSWIYPAVLRLYSLGFINHVYLGMRPWTRNSLNHMLEDAAAQLEDVDIDKDPAAGEAQDIYQALTRFLQFDTQGPCLKLKGNARVESVYSVARGISGTPLRDSFHLGSTIVNDYGRPYQNGFNSYSGASGYAAAGRFVFYARGEFEAAPSATGYSQALASALSAIDGTSFYIPATTPPYGSTTAIYNQATIPMGPIATTTNGRVIEAFVSGNLLKHEISFGKQDDWLGPGLGGGMAYSNNAENIYSFRINRVEPLYVPLLSRLTGPFRYEFLIGSLRGHTYMPNPSYLANPSPKEINVINPGDPWVHLEKVSFRPTENLEFGFERTAIWGGQGHAPITIDTFLKSFFSFASPSTADKNGRNDPGARFGAFDFSYRLPFVRNWLTLYTDSEVHDDVSPADAPRRAAYRPGLYLSHVPGLAKLDLRVEAASTDPSSSNTSSHYGRFMYWENIQKQGYTNQGQMFGDWIGREAKGGQAWITYHLKGNEWIQAGYRNQKATTYFIPGGTTLNDINFQAVKRIGKDFEIDGNFAYERWKAPMYPTGTPVYPAPQQTVTTTTIQLTWFPERKVSF